VFYLLAFDLLAFDLLAFDLLAFDLLAFDLLAFDLLFMDTGLSCIGIYISMSKRERIGDRWSQSSSTTNAVVTMHIPVYTKRESVFTLDSFYILKVGRWQDSEKKWHFRHTPCVVFEGVNCNRFCLYGDDTLRSAPMHHNMSCCLSRLCIPPASLNIERDRFIVQNKTAVISSDGEELVVCPVFDHEVSFKKLVNASKVHEYASAIQRYQAMHFERAWNHIEFVNVKLVEVEVDLEGGRERKLELVKRKKVAV